ncbi:hypothetical protein AVEN_47782-1 [Araneus ventricosus]|uniref:Uncharacterized protein n=1 Tax=Araneus ventricosus TaxID=182803 RepID=A0A4Y2S3V5_ARAVE|nr:hypothetical protein AVEN_47782-1 [Araneus ventricosus]
MDVPPHPSQPSMFPHPLNGSFRSSGSSSETLGSRTRCRKEESSHGPMVTKFIIPNREKQTTTKFRHEEVLDLLRKKHWREL